MTKIPIFLNDDEEREFWKYHSVEEFKDELEEIKSCCPNCRSEVVSWKPGEAECSECDWKGSPYDLLEED